MIFPCEILQTIMNRISIHLVGMLSKYEWTNDTYSSLFVTTDYTLYDFVGHQIFQLGSMLVRRNLSQTTRCQTSWRSIHLETDITTCSHIAEIEIQAFYFQLQWQTLHGHSKQSGRSGLGPNTFLWTEHAHEHFQLIIHLRIVDIKTSKQGHL